jgi:hypothetical protein
MQRLAGAGAAFLALLELVADGAQETRAPGDSILALDADRREAVAYFSIIILRVCAKSLASARKK